MGLPLALRPSGIDLRARLWASAGLDRARGQHFLLPSGWSYGPPDYVGVGAHRSGTTWWGALIQAHPGVYRAPRALKEKRFFGPFANRRFTEADIARYHRCFPRPPGAYSGEWTPAYLCEIWTPALLARAAPHARILVSLRDPVERYRSAVGDGRLGRLLSERDWQRIAVLTGFYGAQLRALLESFAREQVLVLQYERCVAAPVEELRRTYAFLGLDESFVPPSHARVRNAARGEKPDLAPELAEALRAAYRPDAERVVEEFGLDPALWPTLS
ncbi:MAG: hypothetical protein QOE36_173 [Gaiellaceae bacterium]|nr:hypothetical protein [Gaiellaceae bacterium]